MYEISLHTLLVKYFNDLLGRQSSERGRDEVTSFYVGDLFCIHLVTRSVFHAQILSFLAFFPEISVEIFS